MKLRRQVTYRSALVVAMLAAHSALLAWSGWVHFPTIDEMGHLPAGVSHWRIANFRLYHVNPPLVRMAAALPLLPLPVELDWSGFSDGLKERPEFGMGGALLHRHGFSAVRYFAFARWACLPFSLVGAIACYCLSQRLYGGAAGLLAVLLWCFSPSVLAYGALITPDVGAAATGVLAWLAFDRWLKTPTFLTTTLLGCATGAALLTKTSWLCLFALFPAVLGLDCLLRRPAAYASNGNRALQLLIAMCLSVYLINFGYGFEGSFTPLREYEFLSRALGGLQNGSEWSPGNRYVESIVADVRVPLPRSFVQGIDHVKWEFERGYPSYLRGEWRHGGWGYYYLYALLVKTPIGTLGLFAAALGVTVCKAWRRPTEGRCDVLVLAPAATVLTLVSSQTGFNHHLRYVVPALPFLFVWASQLANAVSFRRPLRSGFILAAVAWSLASSMWMCPHSLSYFNELAGGPHNGNKHLHNSNVDWGQDLTYLKLWTEEHPDVTSLGVAPYHWVNLNLMGLNSSEANHWPVSPGDGAESIGPLPGWYAISKNHLVGEPHESFEGRPSRAYHEDPSRGYFNRLKPIGSVGYSMNLYHVSLEEANTLRAEFRLPLLLKSSVD